jgi:hypothetical protein
MTGWAGATWLRHLSHQPWQARFGDGLRPTTSDGAGTLSFSKWGGHGFQLTPPVSIKKTITPDYLISLEYGKQYKSLKRHLSIRGLTPEEYRSKWGLPADYPMA